VSLEKFRSDIQERKDKETGFSASYDDRFEIYESHVDLDIPGYEDWIKTASQQVLLCHTS
jgi:hypothetical protein